MGESSETQNYKKGSNFKEEEKVNITRAWLTITEDPITGTNQTADHFWDRVYEEFIRLSPRSAYRTPDSVRIHFGKYIKRECQFYTQCLRKAHSSQGSGENMLDMGWLVLGQDATYLWASLERSLKPILNSGRREAHDSSFLSISTFTQSDSSVQFQFLSKKLRKPQNPSKNPTHLPLKQTKISLFTEKGTDHQSSSSSSSSSELDQEISKLDFSKSIKLGTKINVSNNTKVWIVIGIGVAGILILSETRRRRRSRINEIKEDFGVFIERFELLPSPQPPPPAARLPLSGLTFAVKDIFDVKDYVTGFGNPDWKRTHEVAQRTAVAVASLLKNGATCVGKTVMDELGLGITGENMHYGTPTNPEVPTQIPGGSSSGSAVAVAAQLVDFALGTDTFGCVRTPASFCGVLGFRPSHGSVSTIGVLANSQSLDTVGWFARDPSILHRVGHVLLQLSPVENRRVRRLVFADDCFQLSKVPKQKSFDVVSKSTEKLSGYQPPKNVNIGQYIASNVPSLKGFQEPSANLQHGTSTLKALSSVMLLLQRYEFKTNHEEWVNTVKPKLGPDISARVLAAVSTSHDNIKTYYKVRTEMRAALHSLLKDGGILVIPTISDFPLKLNSKKSMYTEFQERALALLSIAGMSGCCQVTVPLGMHDGFPISISLIASHGADKFLLDTVLDMYSSLQEQVSIASNSSPQPDTNGNLDTSELLKEKGNAAFKGRQWNKAVNYYSEAINLNDANATYYCNRAAAYLELGCFQQAEEDCTKAISRDKKNVKAYLRRGTAKEMRFCYKEAAQDFKHALVLEPQNKVASLAEKRLRKLAS